MKRIVPLKDAWKVLNPCPTVLVSAAGKKWPQVCAVAWCMPLDFNPPKALLVLAAGQATADAATAAGELVINVPGADIVDKVLAVGRTSGKERNKFRDFGLRVARSRRVKAPGVADCLANLECRILERKTTLGRALRKKYDTVIVEILECRAESGAFDGRWLLEKNVRLLHHLGSEGFEVSGGIVKPKKIF